MTGRSVAQVLGELSDEPIGDPFDLNTLAMLSLPAGEYRLRVTGVGRLSRTFRFAVNRGETICTRFRSMRGGCCVASAGLRKSPANPGRWRRFRLRVRSRHLRSRPARAI